MPPIKINDNLPAKILLEEENIFLMDKDRADSQDIRPLKIAILNLMPLKEDTEVQLLRCLSNSALQLDVSLLKTKTYVGKNTSTAHLDKFYYHFEDIKDKKLDGLIITGAPVEQMDFEEVAYWDELVEIMDWADKNVTSTLHICWGAQAALYHKYGINKYPMEEKLSGIYNHNTLDRREPLVRGFDDTFLAPHSRYTTVYEEDINKNKELKLLATSDEAGVFLAIGRDGKDVFVTGHPEYDRMTLDYEYHRDMKKGLNPNIIKNYYVNDDPSTRPVLTWRAHSNLLYSNWLNYYVYQKTPYEL
ncbi:MAG: homoserine O-succinyltransferase [Lachnospiraceae bacterium]|nr:homoserine O-succinyltransferase [Lachnospiraceae bacterium]